MNMEKINVNSMEYRKLSKQDKLKVVNFKINEILNDKDSQKVYEYYRGKKVGVPKSKAGIFRDLCERKKSLEKTIVSYSDVQPVNEVIETTVKDAEIVDPIDEEIADIDKKIRTIKQALNNIFEMHKLDKYKSNIIKINYRGESKFIPYSKLGDCKQLYRYLVSLEKKKRELEDKRNIDKSEVIESETEKTKVDVITNYEYYSDDGNPYESGYMMFPTKNHVETAGKLKLNNEDTESENKNTEDSNLRDKNTQLAVVSPSVKDLAVKDTDDKKNKEEKNNKNKKKKKFNKFFGKIAAIPFMYGIVKGIKKFGKKIGNKCKNVWNITKNKVNNISEMLRKNKVKTAICALIVAATTVVCSFLPRSNSKKHDTSSIVTPTSVSETTNDEKETIIEESTKPTEVEDKVVENEVSQDITDTKEYELGENVTLSDNSYIYTNSYDATSETNSYVPYYDNSYDREVVGVTYELDGQLYTIYKYDNDAINKVNELINKGAKQTAVLVVRSDLINTGDYEGYYNVDSVKRVKTK